MNIRTTIRDKYNNPIGWIIESEWMKHGYTNYKGLVGYYDKRSKMTRYVNGELYSRDDDLRALIREEASN